MQNALQNWGQSSGGSPSATAVAGRMCCGHTIPSARNRGAVPGRHASSTGGGFFGGESSNESRCLMCAKASAVNPRCVRLGRIACLNSHSQSWCSNKLIAVAFWCAYICVPQHPLTASKHSLPTLAINSFSFSFCAGVISLDEGVMARCFDEGLSKTRERGRAMAMLAWLSLASWAAFHAASAPDSWTAPVCGLPGVVHTNPVRF